MTVQEQIDYMQERIAKHQHRTRKELETSLRAYFMWHGPDHATAGDVNNLVQQGVDAIEAVMAGYPPFRETRSFGALGIKTLDTRTLATD